METGVQALAQLKIFTYVKGLQVFALIQGYAGIKILKTSLNNVTMEILYLQMAVLLLAKSKLDTLVLAIQAFARQIVGMGKFQERKLVMTLI